MNPTTPAPVAVLGGTGFFGRNVCAAFHEAGYPVVSVGRSAAEPPPGCRAARIDLTEAEPREIAALLHEIGAATVVNAAGALWAVDGVQLTEQQVTDGSLRLVQNLLDALGELAARPLLVHLGSTYEYGAQPAGTLLTEDTPENASAHYGAVKLAATRLVREAAQAGTVDAVTLRATTSTGPWAPAGSLLGRVAHGLAARPDRLEIPALDGERDFVDARDVAAAALAVAAQPRGSLARDLYNVASGVSVRVEDAVELLIETARQDTEIVRLPRVASRADAGSVGTQRIDIRAAHEQLDWRPRHTLAESLAALWETVGAPAGRSPRLSRP
jgi:nucleoside-diphosphate-sugar epimerase